MCLRVLHSTFRLFRRPDECTSLRLALGPSTFGAHDAPAAQCSKDKAANRKKTAWVAVYFGPEKMEMSKSNFREQTSGTGLEKMEHVIGWMWYGRLIPFDALDVRLAKCLRPAQANKWSQIAFLRCPEINSSANTRKICILKITIILIHCSASSLDLAAADAPATSFTSLFPWVNFKCCFTDHKLDEKSRTERKHGKNCAAGHFEYSMKSSNCWKCIIKLWIHNVCN